MRQAATVVVLRRGDAGMQVLLMRRAPREGDIHSGASVFPGGLLDAADAEGSALCSGLDDAQASARLGLPSGGLAYWFAALRECFEEAGLLYAAAQDRSHLDAAQLAQIAHAARRAEPARADDGCEICQRFGIHLAADRIAYLDHWLTPPGVPKRYDTRFFVAEAPELQVASAGRPRDRCAAVADAGRRAGAAQGAEAGAAHLEDPGAAAAPGRCRRGAGACARAGHGALHHAAAGHRHRRVCAR